tara:strand:- start:3793 stop:4896 length:1104 start_codon:yes stop_codon:yes gene_type:complete
MTLDELWKAYEDKDQDFAGDVYDFMKTDLPFKITKEDFGKQYGMYLPEFDYTGIELAERKRDIDYKEARNILDTSIDATNRVYATEMDTLSAGYGSQASKARSMAGRTGLKTGTLDEALETTYEQTANKAKSLGERLDIAQDEAGDKYNIAMVDSALDYDKTVQDEKEDFYNRTLAAIARLDARGVWDKKEGVKMCNGVEIPEDQECVPYQFEGLDLGLGECNPACSPQEMCISGTCVTNDLLNWENLGSTEDIMCGQYADYIEGEGCVPNHPDMQTDIITPDTCPTGTIWSDNAGGCLYINPGDKSVGCAGPCALYLQGGEIGYDFWSKEWDVLHNPTTYIPGAPDPDDDYGKWYDWAYCLIPGNC